MLSRGTAVAVVVAVAAVVAAGIAGAGTAGATTSDRARDNEPPLADAGLDQDVVRNQTVYLDATGSYDPDGHVDAYSWSIERPNGSVTTPVCPTCGRTKFYPQQLGQYNVTVTVTDDDGAQRSDTLYVQVDPVPRPTVDLSGPATVQAGTTVQVTADAAAHPRGGDLVRVRWTVDGHQVATRALDGRAATPTLDRAFTPGEHTVRVTVRDHFGRTATATHTLTVESVDDDGAGSDSEYDGIAGPGGHASEDAIDCYVDGGDDCFDSSLGPGATLQIRDSDDDGRITIGGELLSVSGALDDATAGTDNEIDTVEIDFSTWIDAHSDDVSDDEDDDHHADEGDEEDDGDPGGATRDDSETDTSDGSTSNDGDGSTSTDGDESTSDEDDDDEWDREDKEDSGNYSEITP